jgi:hypothetical protein
VFLERSIYSPSTDESRGHAGTNSPVDGEFVPAWPLDSPLPAFAILSSEPSTWMGPGKTKENAKEMKNEQ